LKSVETKAFSIQTTEAKEFNQELKNSGRELGNPPRSGSGYFRSCVPD
jgi:hypothetical protein